LSISGEKGIDTTPHTFYSSMHGAYHRTMPSDGELPVL
jgi:hypothetical protein